MSLNPQNAWLPWEPSVEEPWNRRRAAHLFRRAGFAANSAQLDEAVKAGPQATLKKLLSPTEPPAFAAEMQRLAGSLLASGNAKQLSVWWLYRMLHTPAPLVEKMTLFWHGHFATSADKVTDAELMFAQNALLREHALGSFEKLVQGIARDPAMLIYLDSTTNKKSHPNENFAREVMELFCLGLGNYTEKDIQQLARCFTGWEVQRGEFKFNQYQHDYGKKTVLGKSGDFDGNEGVEVILEQKAAPQFIAKKLVRFFVCDDDVPLEFIEPLAQKFRDSDLTVAPLVETILSSRYFYSEASLGRKIRSPVKLGIGMLRALEATGNLKRMSEELGELGQMLLYPPNVKGWDGGVAWINSATLLGRANLIKQVLDDGNTRYSGGSLADYFDKQGWKAPGETVDRLAELLVATQLSAELRGQLIAILEKGGANRGPALRQVIHTLGATPEFQLS